MSQATTEPVNPITDFQTKFESAWKKDNGKPSLMVEHYMVNWTIDNFKLLLIYEDCISISSPIFFLDSSRTSWNIEIYSTESSTNAKGTFVPSLCFLLRRTDIGQSPMVGLTFRLGISKFDSQIIWLEEKKICEISSSFYCKSTMTDSERNTFSENITEYENRFVVKCEMYVTYKIPCYDTILLTPADYDIVNFSFDFAQLMSGIESADYSVITSRTSIRTHKAILAARSKVFYEILKNPDYKTSVTFDDVTFKNMLAVLNFIYSGNLSKALKDLPNIGFYECARKFAVEELLDFLTPKLIQIRSILKTQEINFTWNINNFSQCCTNDRIYVTSPKFCSAAENAQTWVLTLSLWKAHDHLAISAQTNHVTKSLHSILKISLVDRDDKLVKTQTIQRFQKHKQTFGFNYFLNGFSAHDTLLGLVVRDTLRVFCEIIFVVSSDVHETHVLSTTGATSVLDSYRCLSRDISQLMNMPDLSDVEIKTYNFSLMKAHKPVLFARSRGFHSKFLYYNKYQRTIDVFDIHPDTVLQMIRHAYTGRFEPMPIEDSLRLYYASEKYTFRQLILITLHHLVSQINVENFFQLYNESRNFPHRYLQVKCEAFALQNAKTIVETGNWEQWRQQNDELCNILINLLRTPTFTV